MSRLALAVDLGGTKLEAALVDDTGRVVPESRVRRPTGPGLTADDLRHALDGAMRGAAAAAPHGTAPDGIGVGTAGPLDRLRGVIEPVNLPGVSGFALHDEVARVAALAGLAIPVAVGHDGACLALAESWVGATRNARASLSMVVSTGIGGGFVIDGTPMAGASGNAGHLGQMHAGPDVQTLEEVASGPASVGWARAQGWSGASGEDLARDAPAGDSRARAAIERSATAVGRVLADVSVLVDLDVISIGGGFSRVSDDYVELVGSALRDAAVLPYAARTRVVRSGLAHDGPLIGAAALVMRADRHP